MNPILGYGGIAAAAVLAATAAYTGGQMMNARHEATEQSDRADKALLDLGQCNVSLVRQNGAVDALKAAADVNKRIGDEARKAAAAELRLRDNTIARLRALPKPPPPQQCGAALDLIRSTISEERR